MPKIKVLLLRGGPSSEHEVSLETGLSVLKHLPKDKYQVTDVVISKKGEWLINGKKVSPEKIIKHYDVVFNALHGEYGEDGQIQAFLDKLGIPYTGSKATASKLSMDKVLTKENVYPLKGIKEQRYVVIAPADRPVLEKKLNNAKEYLSLPFIIKPVVGGSSVGLTLAKSVSEAIQHVQTLLNRGSVLIEEYIKGIEATCGVVEKLNGEDVLALPPVEIRPKGQLFDYHAKYSGETEEICPGNFSSKITKILQQAAVQVHKKLGLRHYSRSDFIVAQDKVYFLEVNSLPGLTSQSLLPKSLATIGVSFSEFLDHLIQLALS